MPVYWFDGLSVNVEQIDEQHKMLLMMINDLEEAILNKRGVRELGKISDRMIVYAREHFALEESLMEEHGFPGAGAHLSQHEEFVEKVMSVEFAPDDEANDPEHVLQFLRDWLISHIHGTDKALGAYLNGQGVS